MTKRRPPHAKNFRTILDLTETPWTREVCEQLEALGVKVYVINQTVYGSKGVPDRWIIGANYSVMVEFKDPKTEFQPRQRDVLQEGWYNCPGSVFMARRIELTKIGRLYRGNDLEKPIAIFNGGRELDQLLRKHGTRASGVDL